MWLFELLSMTAPGRAIVMIGASFWAVLSAIVTCKLLLQHAWVYAGVAALITLLLVLRIRNDIRFLLARRRKAESATVPGRDRQFR